ncbi:MAG: DUF5686 family protein [Flavobacteriales bacterium]
MKTILALFLLLPLSMLSQISGTVKDSKSDQKLAFVTVVVKGQQRGTSTDIDGYFRINASVGDVLMLSYVGYKTEEFEIKSLDDLNLTMSPKSIEIKEAVVLAGENPAHRIIQKVIDNKKQNAPEGEFAFSYDAYSKLVFTALIDSALQNDPSKIQELDSGDIEMIDFLKNQHLFLMESISERQFLPPDRSTEKIKASKVTGLSDPDFALLASQLQSFNFYNKEIQLLGNSFYSPTSKGAINKYVYTLEDTTYLEQDTVFIIAYQPRKGKNVKSLEGLLYINTSTYALQSVIAQPNQALDGFNIEIKQLFERVNNDRWFPKQLNSLITFTSVELEAFNVVGIGRTYISNVQIDPPIKKRDIGYLAVSMDPNATNQPDSLWDIFRADKFDSKDSTTYVFMDSVSKAENFDLKYKMLQALMSGKIPIKKFNIDLGKLMAFNSYEGFRLGLGIETSNRLSPKFKLAAYGAYGFKDKAWKYGSEASYWFKKSADARITWEGSVDVMERGRQDFLGQRSFLQPDYVYEFFTKKMDQKASSKVSIGSKLPLWLEIRGAFVMNQWKSTDDYLWITEANENFTLRSDLTEEALGELKLRWSYNEKVIETRNRRIVFESKYPVVQVTYEQGLPQVWGDLDYSRVSMQIDQVFRTAAFGTINLRMLAGKIEGDAPAFRQFNIRSSGINGSIVAPYSMETIEPQQASSSEYVMFSFRHNFKDLLLSTKRFKPGLTLVHNAVWGVKPIGQHENYASLDLQQGHLEAGAELSNIIRFNTSAFGVGAFFNYNDGNGVGFKEDVYLKLVSSFAF